MADATVLISLYRSTSGESWQKKKKWLSSEPVCSWYGVECGSNDGIISLRLNENHLGPGTVPTELGDLTAMSTYFRLDGNSLSGTIPSELGRLSLMTSVFYLWGNRFTGELPSELGSLTGLTSNFAVSSNQLSGTLPSQLGRLSKLTIELRLQANQFSGPLPSELGMLSGLNAFFDVRSNLFCGSIPNEMVGMPIETEGNNFGEPCEDTMTAQPTPMSSKNTAPPSSSQIQNIQTPSPIPHPTSRPHMHPSIASLSPVPAPSMAKEVAYITGGDSDGTAVMLHHGASTGGIIIAVTIACLAMLVASRLAYLLFIDRPWERIKSRQDHTLVMLDTAPKQRPKESQRPLMGSRNNATTELENGIVDDTRSRRRRFQAALKTVLKRCGCGRLAEGMAGSGAWRVASLGLLTIVGPIILVCWTTEIICLNAFGFIDRCLGRLILSLFRCLMYLNLWHPRDASSDDEESKYNDDDDDEASSDEEDDDIASEFSNASELSDDIDYRTSPDGLVGVRVIPTSNRKTVGKSSSVEKGRRSWRSARWWKSRKALKALDTAPPIRKKSTKASNVTTGGASFTRANTHAGGISSSSSSNIKGRNGEDSTSNTKPKTKAKYAW